MSSTMMPQSLQFIDGATSSFDIGNSIATDAVGNVYVCGITNSGASGLFTFAGQNFYKPVTSGTYTMFIGKIGANGVPQWLRMLDSTGDDRANSISCADNGDVYVAGRTDILGSGAVLTFIVCSTTPGGFTSTSYFKNATTGQSIVLLKLDTNGYIITPGPSPTTVGWLRILDGALDEEAFSIKAKPNSTFVYFTGYTTTTAATPFQYTTCTTVGATSVPFAKPATTAQSILIGGINASTGVCDWINLVDGLAAGATEQGNSIAWEEDFSGGALLITGFTSSTTGYPTTNTINFIQCTSTGPATSTPYTKVVTVSQALFILILTPTGAFASMNLLDSSGIERGIAVNIGYDSTFNPKVYITALVSTSSSTMSYSSVVAAGVPSAQPWNIPTLTQIATLIAKIDFFTNNLESLTFFDTASGINPDVPTGIAVKSNLIDPTFVYVCGTSTWGGGTLNYWTASTSLPLPPVETYTVPALNDDNSFILKLDESLDYVESKWIDRADPSSVPGSYKLTGIAIDTQDNIYVIGVTDQTPAASVNFAGEVFQKPLTTSTSTFIGKLGLPPQLSAICYAKGTLIGTDRGFVPIEDIRLSDKIRTYGRIEENTFTPVHGVPFKTLTRAEDTRIKNRFANIKFIGHFSTKGMHEKTAPICITAGALGENKPERDLFVSPNHSILIGDRMVFAKDMVNEISIYQDMSFEKIEYYHILSHDHYIINANGILSETLGTEELKLFETMIYAQSKVYEPLALENKYHLQDIAT